MIAHKSFLMGHRTYCKSRNTNCPFGLQGLLALEGELTPILVQMVKSANMNGLLDSDSDSLNSCQQKVKARLHDILQRDRTLTPEDYEKVFRYSALICGCMKHCL